MSKKFGFILKDRSSSCAVNIKGLDLLNQEVLTEINKNEIVSNPGI